MRRYFIALLFSQLSLYAIAQSGVSMSLFSGRMSYSIPIYTVEDPDFHLEIALRYSTEGFKPFQPSGCYGQDWSLVAGGCITRFVQGIADEWMYEYDSPPGKSDYIEYGFMRAFDYFEDIEEDSPNKEQVFNLDSSVCDTCGIYSPEIWLGCKSRKIDYLPDIFYFNFCGHKGRFMINNSGKVVILNGDFVKVDLSEIRTTATNMGNVLTSPSPGSKIVIKTTDGYTYIFGGNASALEYSVYTPRNSYQLIQNTPSVIAWYLTQIVAPNNRALNFTYNSGSSSNYGVHALKSFITDYDWCEQETQDSTHIIYSLHKECLLQSITTSDSIPLTISFFSHDEASKMYEHNDFTMCKPHLQLDSIIVSYNGDTLKRATLSYQYRTTDYMYGAYPNYWWKYLSQVAISGVGKYRMTYNDIKFDAGISNHPIYYTAYPTLYPQTDDNYKDKVDRFGFWKRTSLQGLLSAVTLPTGGKVKFAHEGHQYGEERRFRVVGTKDIELNIVPVANQPIGGARIKKIETYSDDSTLVETKTFSYNKQGTANSSGIYYNIYNVFYPDTICPITNPYNYGLIDSHIGYSYVEQQTTIETDNYKTTYSFDTGRRTYSSLNNSLINRNDSVPGYKDTTEVCSGTLTFDGWLIAPGKLLKTDMYKGTTLAKTVQYQYNGVSETSSGSPTFTSYSLGCVDTIVCFSKYSAHVARKLLICPDVLEKVTTREYADGYMMETIQNYTYDRKLRKKEETMTDSRGMQHFTRYTYPDNFHFSGFDVLFDPPAVYQLRKKHRINIPVEQVSGYIENGEEYITSGTAKLYGNIWVIEDFNNNAAHLPVRPDWDSVQSHIIDSMHHSLEVVDYYPYLYKTLSLALNEPIPASNYQCMSTNGASIVHDPHYKSTCEYQFDIMDRLTSIKPAGQAATKYTWNGIYPATKTIGNQTWTYTHKPYVGITSMTDPRGITTYYKYDSAGRPIEEYQMVNGRKHILKAYQYHIKTE